jgi:hypothetical protein
MKNVLIGLTALLALSAASVCAKEHGDKHGGDYGRGGGRPEAYAPPRGGPGAYPQGGYPQAGYAPRGYGPGGFAAPPRGGYPGPVNPVRGYPGAGYPGQAYPGAGMGRGFSRGQFLPPGYGGGVVDPRQYHLRRPPNGYGWVTVGPNAYLTQRSTGLILDTAPLY